MVKGHQTEMPRSISIMVHGGRLLESTTTPMASVRGAGGRGSQGRASRLSQLVKAATERQEQRPISTASRSIDTPLRIGGLRSREADSVLGQRGGEEATFYSDEEDSEDDEDEL